MDAKHEQKIISCVLDQVKVLITAAIGRNNSCNTGNLTVVSNDDSVMKKLNDLEQKFDIIYHEVRDNPMHDKLDALDRKFNENNSKMDVLLVEFDKYKIKTDKELIDLNKTIEEYKNSSSKILEELDNLMEKINPGLIEQPQTKLVDELDDLRKI